MNIESTARQESYRDEEAHHEPSLSTATLPPAPSQIDELYHFCEDTTLPYRSGYRIGFCRLRLFQPRERPISASAPVVALVTEHSENEGLSITNGIEVIATAICRRYGLNPQHTILIEHYDDRAQSDSWEQGFAARLPGRSDGEKFSCVIFEAMQTVKGEVKSEPAAFRLRRPQWQPLSKSAVEALIGAPLP